MNNERRKEFLNIPNYISFGRIASVPLIVILMMFINDANGMTVWNSFWSFISALVYGIASFSDVIDGFLARRMKLVGNFGKFFDPVADKLLNLAAMIMLIPLARIPAWFVILILVREVMITMLRGVAAHENVIIQASKWGKYKNAFGSFGISFLILHYPFLGVNWILIGWVLLIVSAIFCIGSGAHYVWKFVQEIAKLDAAKASEAVNG